MPFSFFHFFLFLLREISSPFRPCLLLSCFRNATITIFLSTSSHQPPSSSPSTTSSCFGMIISLAAAPLASVTIFISSLPLLLDRQNHHLHDHHLFFFSSCFSHQHHHQLPHLHLSSSLSSVTINSIISCPLFLFDRRPPPSAPMTPVDANADRQQAIFFPYRCWNFFSCSVLPRLAISSSIPSAPAS